jgi:CRP-like cAMP-binding protein
MHTLMFKAGENIFSAGEKGSVYRVLSGSVRLNRSFHDAAPAFASLAVAQDLIGAEVLVEEIYSFDAQALTDCQLEVCKRGSLWGESFAKELLKSIRRKTDVVTLRCGSAKERITRLIQLLNRDGEDIQLPKLKDISDITDITIETVSRTISGLRKQNKLLQVKGARGNIRNRYQFLSGEFI